MNLDAALLAELRTQAASLGLLRLGAVSLDNPGFAPARAALTRYLDAGKAGEMGFMTRTREVRQHPEGMLEGARSALIGVVPCRGEPGPVARYARGVDYHTELYRRLERLSETLAEHLPGVQTLVCVDTKPLLERSAAALAGLGFLGKNGCLIVPGLGSHVLLGCMLTTATWVDDETPVPVADPPWDACGTCTACLDGCPTSAFDAPGDLDPRRCISYLTIEARAPIEETLMAQMGERIAGCDVCQDVCPYNRGDREARVPDAAWLPPAPGRDRTPDLVKLANVGNNQHRGFVRHTALNRIPRKALRRNALIALGNRTVPLQDEERAALKAAAKDADEELARVANWALARRGP